MTFPIGLSYLGTYLIKHGIDVTIFDMNVYPEPYISLNKILNKNFTLIGISLRNLDQYIPVYSPTNYLKYIYNQGYLNELENLINIIKNKKPGTPLVLGGAGFTILAKELMNRYKDIDFGAIGESEITLLGLTKNIGNPEKVKGVYYRKGNNLFLTGKPNKIKNIDFIPKKNIKGLPNLKTYDSIGVQSKRGCIYNCIYCVEPYIQEGQLLLRNINSVIEELKELKKKGISKIVFADCVVNSPIKHFELLCKAIISNDLKIKWRGYFRFENLNKDLIKLAIKSGCNNFIFSPDSDSRKIRKLLGTNIKNEKIIDTIHCISKYDENADLTLCFLLNSPGENTKTLLKTFLLIYELKKINPKINMDFSSIRIYPHTILYNKTCKLENKDMLKSIYYNPFPLKLFVVPFIIIYYLFKNKFQILILKYLITKRKK
ncbi:MAG: cobalamin-dependent protein [Nanoarchaeota archaeon]